MNPLTGGSTFGVSRAASRSGNLLTGCLTGGKKSPIAMTKNVDEPYGVSPNK